MDAETKVGGLTRVDERPENLHTLLDVDGKKRIGFELVGNMVVLDKWS